MNDLKTINFYRKLSRFLSLKEFLNKNSVETMLRIRDDLEKGIAQGKTNGESEKLRVLRPEKISHKAVPHFMIETPKQWKAGIDFPIMIGGDIKSDVNQQAIKHLQQEYNNLSKEIIKETDFDFNKVHNELSREDLPQKHIVTTDDYKTIWYNGKEYKLSPNQQQFTRLVHGIYLETNELVIDTHSIFLKIKLTPKYRVSRLFDNGLFNNLYHSHSKFHIELDLEF